MDRNYMRATGRVQITPNNIIFRRGHAYPMERKLHVGNCYAKLFQMYCMDPSNYKEPSPSSVANLANVGYKFAKKVMDEIQSTGSIVDPDTIKAHNYLNRKSFNKLKVEHQMFILSLHAVLPNRPNESYVDELYADYKVIVCSSTITNFFRSKMFKYKGTFGVPNNVPLDKFKQENILKFYQFQEVIQRINNKCVLNFLDEKHIINSDCIPKKVRRNPVFGYMPAIMVSGDFREAFNIFACITANPNKQNPIAYNIQKDNGSAVSFVAFIKQMIYSGWLGHNEVLVMDNAAIHSGGEAEIVKGLLWETMVNGAPLRILVVYLPTRSPELNPIELIFHILSRRVCSYHYCNNTKKGMEQIEDKWL